MMRSIWASVVCFLLGAMAFAYAQSTGVRPDQFVALPWSWSATQTFDGSHNVTGLPNPTASSDAANKAYVDNVAAGLNPAIAVQAATTANSDTSGLTYTHVDGGIGDILTGSNNTAITVDGFTFTAVGQRLLVKNDTRSISGAVNGIWYVTQLQGLALPPILTRALDYDQPSDINNTGAIPVVNGTVNGSTSWLLTSSVGTVGTDPLTYVQFSINPTNVLTTNTAQTVTATKSSTPQALTISTATFTPAAASGNNIQFTLVHASCPCTLANPSGTPVAGTSGVIEVTQSATGSDTIGTWGSSYLYTGGTSAIALSTAANAVDTLSYYVRDSTHIVLTTAALNATH